MEGASYAVFLDRPEDGEYHITMPNMCVPISRFLPLVLTLRSTTQVRSRNLVWKGWFFTPQNREMITEYARLQMVLELGDTSMVKNEINGLSCEIEFKTKVRSSPPSSRSSSSFRNRVSFQDHVSVLPSPERATY